MNTYWCNVIMYSTSVIAPQTNKRCDCCPYGTAIYSTTVWSQLGVVLCCVVDVLFDDGQDAGFASILIF